MKGIIFRYLEDYVCENLGLEAWDALIQKADLQNEGGIFISPQNYADEDLFALVSVAQEMTQLPLEKLLFSFGEYLGKRFSMDYAKFFEACKTAKEFIQSIHCVIHVEVKKLHRDAHPPDLLTEDSALDHLSLDYFSGRKLCHVLRGITQAVSDYYQTPIEMDETQCMHDGAGHCHFEMTFYPPKPR